MLKRKITELGSCLYRHLLYPFVRIGIEIGTKSVMLPGSYLHGHSRLEGRNYIGRATVLNHTSVGYGSQVNNGGDLTDTAIGRYTSIGANVSTVIGEHPLDEHVSTHTAFYDAGAPLGFTYVSESTFCDEGYLDAAERIRVRIGNDVWIGNNVSILSGVTIGDGAVIGAGSVVTKDVQPYGIYAGVPAKLIRKRFDDATVSALLEKKWWDLGEDWIRSHIEQFADVKEMISKG